ncbi:MAG: phosphate ABC transporter permease subunit PstC [Proteobacteria bacterium]|nr:phosphate ABC transporter permease subunit PstC [Pseudomonadota bacterium]
MRRNEYLIKAFFFLTACVSVTILALIMIFLVKEGAPILSHVTLKEFLFGQYWYPTDDPVAFGIFPLIVGTVSVTLISTLVSVPLGVMTAVYIAEIATDNLAAIIKPLVELIAAIPSVVIGFFGMVVVSPFLQDTFGVPTGLNLFNASLMLAFMATPTICSVTEDAIRSVPESLKEASLALGATHLETIFKVTVPAAISGISTAIILGMSRAVGETMVVLMVAGGAAMNPHSLFDPVRPMPASIAAEMGEAAFGSEHYNALFATGVVLFLFTLGFNLFAAWIAGRYNRK